MIILRINLKKQCPIVLMTVNRSKLKVLFITRKWPPAVGGMERYSKELSEKLKSCVDLNLLKAKGQANGKPPTPFSLFIFFIKASLYLLRNNKKHDVVHFTDLVLFPLVWLHWMISRKKIRIITVHGLDMLYGNRNGLAPAVYRKFMKWVIKNEHMVSHYIANSRYTADIAHTIGLIPVTPIPLAVSSISSNYQSYSKNKKYIFFFGRIVPRKGVRWFINEVLPLLSNDIDFILAGKIWDQNELKGIDTNRVKYFGIVSETKLHGLCSRALAVVIPNISMPGDRDVEGFGLVAVEAAAKGAVVLASDLEGIRDAVRHGETGFLIKTHEPLEWAKQINNITHWKAKDRSTFIDQSFASIRLHYSWDRVAKDTLNIYKSFF